MDVSAFILASIASSPTLSTDRRDIKKSILQFLQYRPMTGYDIHRRLGNKISKGGTIFKNNRDKTGIRISIQNLYPHLHSLRDRGLIEQDDRSRKDSKHGNVHYRLTTKGWIISFTNNLVDVGAYLHDNDLSAEGQPFFVSLLLPFFKPETLKEAHRSPLLMSALLAYLKDCCQIPSIHAQRTTESFARTKILRKHAEKRILFRNDTIGLELIDRGHKLVFSLITLVGELAKVDHSDNAGELVDPKEELFISGRGLADMLASDAQFVEVAEVVQESFNSGCRRLTGLGTT